MMEAWERLGWLLVLWKPGGGGELKELKLSQSSNDLSCHQCAEGKYLCIRLSLKHKLSFSVYLT